MKGNKNVLKLGTFYVVILIVMAFISSVGFNASAEAPGIQSGSYRYILNGNKATIIDADGATLKGDVKIPETLDGYKVVGLAAGAFSICPYITSITIHSYVEKIEPGAILECVNLKKISVSAGNFYYSSDSDGCLYNKGKTVLIRYPGDRVNTTYSVPDGVKEIAMGCFAVSMNLKNVIIPDSVTTVGEMAFIMCLKLESVTFSKNIQKLECDIFIDCFSLKGVALPANLKTIGERAFGNCFLLDEIVMPESLETIEAEAFLGCISLEHIEVNSKYTKLDGSGLGLRQAKFFNISDSGVTNIINEIVEAFFDNDEDRVDELLNELTEYIIMYDSLEPFGTIYCHPGSKAESYAKSNSIPYQSLHVHSYSSKVTTAATCESKGTKTYTCSCGDKYTESINALGHDYSSSYTIDKQATCTASGSKSKHCSRCDAKTSVTTISATGHDYGSWRTTSEATCDSTGTKKRSCNNCGNEESQSISKLGHDYSSSYTVDKEATCTSSGTKSKHCSRCDAKTSSTTISALGHSYGSWRTTKAATCESNGTKKRTCDTCGDEESQSISKTGHDYGSWRTTKEPTCSNNGTKKRSCNSCGNEESQSISKIEHDYDSWKTTKEATCDSNGTKKRNCKNCGNEESGTISKLGHDYSNKYTTDTEPTCTVEGSKSKHCVRCDAKTGSTVIPALGHDFSTEWTTDVNATCVSEGSKSHHCKNCDEKQDITTIEKGEHKYKSKVTAATTKKNGKKVFTCKYCNDVVTKSIAKIASISLSKTTYTYDKQIKSPKVVVKDSNGKTLKKDTHYTVTYSKGRKAVGEYSVKVTFKGNYSGSKTLKFKITLGKVEGLKQNTSKKGIAMYWNDVTGATGYQVYYYDSKTKQYKLLKNFKTNGIHNAGAKGKMKVKVRAYYIAKDGTVHYGAYSSVKTFTAV